MAKKTGRPPIFKTEKALGEAVDAYFNAISFKKAIPSVLDANGNQYYEIVFREAPTVNGLCLFLGISRKTWENYCANEKFSFVTEQTKMKMEAYCENLLLTREKGSLQGVIFNLQNNYGWRESFDVKHSGEIKNPFSGLTEEELHRLASEEEK